MKFSLTHFTRRPLVRIVSLLLLGLSLTVGGIIALRAVSADTYHKFGISKPSRIGKLLEAIAPNAFAPRRIAALSKSTTASSAVPTALFHSDKQVGYITNSIQFTSDSSEATSWLWDFGDGGTSTLENPAHTYATAGKFNVTLTINGGVDTLTKTGYVHILPNRGTPYVVATDGGTFEINPDDFGSQAIAGGINKWERGVPSNFLTTVNSPVNAWKTDLDADLTSGDYACVLQTPSYNFSSSASAYTLSFRRSMEVVSCNGPFAVQLQYSTDKGLTWTRLGVNADPNATNWYNRGPATGCPIDATVFPDRYGWTLTTSNTLCTYNITTGVPALVGQSDVTFRFVLSVKPGYASNVYAVDGFMVDDFEILGPVNGAVVASPAIITSGTLNPFSSCAGTASAEQSFAVTGANLTSNLVVTAPAGFEVSTTSGSSFAGSVSLTPSSGTVSTTNIFVRMAASASGSPAGSIACTSTGATTQNVSAGGTVSSVTTANAGPDQTLCATSATLAANTPTAGTGAWTIISGTGGTVTTPSSPTSTFTGTAGTTYTLRWTISNAPCTASTDDVVLTFNAAPTITLGANPSVPFGSTSANLPYSATTGSPNQYSIDYNAAANTAGFVDVTNATLTASPIVLVVPGAAASAIYNATLTVRNSATGCVSSATAFTVTVLPTLGNYSATTVALSGQVTVTPSAAPTGTTSILVKASPGFTGMFYPAVTTGVIRIVNAQPAGIHTITVTAISAGGSTTKNFTLTVSAGTACATTLLFSAGSAIANAGSQANYQAIGDFNNDGNQDLVITNSESAGSGVYIRFGDGAGGFTGTASINSGCTPTNIAVGDLNGDGNQDMVLGCNGRIRPYFGNGAGGFTNAVTLTNAGPNSIVLGDFKNEGRLGILVALSDTDTIIYRTFNGTGAGPDISVGDGPSQIVAGDFDADGDLDIATSNQNAGTVSVRLNNGAGSFSGTTEITVGANPRFMALGDFNKDGKLDFVTSNQGAGTLSVGFGNGLGSFTGVTTLSYGYLPHRVLTADVNNDGNADIVVGGQLLNDGQTGVSYLLGDGLGGFAAPVLVSPQPIASATDEGVAIGDFNGDGRQDFYLGYTPTGPGVWLGGCNAAPTITAGATLTRQQGSAGSSATIATVNDTETAAGSLTVQATTIPTGITVTGIVNSGGTVTATVAAACNATVGANIVVLTVTDGHGATSTANLTVNVTTGTPTANAGPDQMLCVTAPATLAANTSSVGTGAWSIVSGPSLLTSQFNSLTNPGATFTPAGGIGTYTLRWTITGTCATSTDDVVLSFSATPTTANAGPDQTLCATSTTLAANAPTVGTGAWSIVSGTGGSVTTPSSPTSGFTGTAGTTYTLRWTISNSPCTASTDDVVITLRTNPTTANAGSDQTLCATSATLAANTPTVGTGAWTIISGTGGTVATPSSPTSAFTGTAGTTYTLRWAISNSPCTASTDDVVITLRANPTTAAAGSDQTLCATSATLAANTPTIGTGAWSIVSGAGGTVTTPSSPTSAFTGTAGVTYTLRWTISNAPCVASTDDVVITLRANPTTAAAGSDQTVCGASATLAANTPTVGTGAWSIVSGAGGTVVTPSSPTSSFAGIAGTTYTLRWTISNAPCTTSTDDVVITLRANPTAANAGPDQTLCATSATLAANTPGVGTGAWTIISGTGGTVTTPLSPTSTFTGTAGNTYTLRWTISNAPCTASTDDVVITLRPSPTIANAGPDQTLCVTAPATLAANLSSAGTGAWSVVSGPSTSPTQLSSFTNPFATFTPAGGAGIYILRWTITEDCATTTDDVVLTYSATPITANAGPDQTLCATSATLAANTPTVGTGSWSIISGAGGTVTTPSSPTSAFTGVAGNSYTLRWTTSNSPCTASTDDVVITLRANPTTAAAGSDQTLCATSATLAANTAIVGTGAWSIVSGTGGTVTTPSSPTSGFTGTAGTTYTLRWTISNSPCTASTDDVVITLRANPTTANAGTDQAVCAASATLAANAPTIGTGAWTIISGTGGTVATPSSPTSAFTGVAGTTYTLRWTISNSPCTASTDDVVITLTANPTTANAGPDQTVCATSATLAANTPTVGTGAWSIVSGTGGTIATPSSPTSAFTGVAGTTYTLRWTISNSPCTASIDDVVITLRANPTVANAGPDQSVCATSATLAANAPTVGTGAWSIVSGAGGSFVNAASPTTTFNGTAGTTYTLRWTISNSPCTASTDDVVITLTANPTAANAGLDQTLCATSATLAANTPTVGTGSWSIVSGAGGSVTTPSSPTSVFTGAAGTTYTLRWTISNSPCTASIDDVVITLRANPTVANAGTDQTLCATSATLAANTPTVGTGAWAIISGTGGTVTTPSSPTSGFTGTAGVTYTLRWTISNSPCTASTDDVVINLVANPTTANAGPDQTLCATSATLAANTPTVGTGAWSIISGAGGSVTTPSSPTSGFTGTAGVTYTLRWTISNSPCTASTDDVVITLIANPTTAAAGSDQAFCGTSAATLAGNTPSVGTGAWMVVSGPSTLASQFSSTSSPTATFTPAGGTGVYTLRWTISNSPCASSTDDVVLTYNVVPTIALGANPSVFAGTTSANLPYSATTGSPNQYSIDYNPAANTAGFADVSNATLTASPIVLVVPGAAPIGTYNATLTVRNSATGCVSSSTAFTITVNNNAPIITAGAALSRQQGTAGSVSTIASVSDVETSTGSLVVTATTTPIGISVTSITNTAGTITANVAANCNATIGANTVVLTVTDGNSATAMANLTVNVTANTAPTLSYGNVSVNSGASTSNSPTTATDNGSITGYSLQSVGTYTGGIAVNASGVVSITAAAPVGTHTITVRATDNCNLTADTTFTINVGNNGPSITPAAALSRQRGTAGSVSTIATVSDNETAAGSLVVTVTTVPSGITVNSITNNNGTITANVAANCAAALGNNTIVLTVTDSNSGTATGNLIVNVADNTAPTLSYANSNVPMGTATTINPTTATDNGAITGYAIQSQGTYTGTISVNASGVVSISNAAPFGTHTIVVRATDNCGATTDASFTLNVGCGTITLANIVNGLTFVPYSVTLTASGGTAPYTFSFQSGTLPSGLTFSGDTISGTPNTAGASTFTIRATDSSNCFSDRTYTLVIGSTGLQYYPLARPVRLLDTRPGQSPNACYQPNAPITGNASRLQPARGTCEGLTIPANATTVTGNITTVQSGGGYLTLYPSDAPQPAIANSNYLANEVLNNYFTVGLGTKDGAFKVFVTSNTDVVIDITGYYAPPGAGGLYYHPLPKPVRLLETRTGAIFTGCTTPGAPLTGGTNTIQTGTGTCEGRTIPSAASALTGNATTVSPVASGYLTLYPANATQPFVASSNYSTGQVINGPFTVGLSPSGQFNIYTHKTTDLVIDITGYYSAQASDANGQGLLFTSLGSPLRLLDTRTVANNNACYQPNAPMLAQGVYTQETQIPCTNLTPTARGLIGNVTVVGPSGNGWLTFWPSDVAQQPSTATSNYTSGQVFNRYFTVGLGPDAAFNRYSRRDTHVVIDISGFFAP